MHRLAFLLALAGCATPLSTYGDQARYAPAYRGYVVAPPNGSDDPDVDDAVLLLRDPLTGDKLRCREQVVGWREVQEDLAADLVHDENTAIAVGTTTGLVFAPFVAVQPLGGAAVVEALWLSELVYDDLSSDDAFELLAGARGLYERKRYRQASTLIERALLKDPTVGVVDMAYYYLGLSYAELGREDRARCALSLFVDRAGVRDVDAYRLAEATLAALGAEPPACESTGPVALHW
jgi:tetratricopeptide (TPR) repeat protein